MNHLAAFVLRLAFGACLQAPQWAWEKHYIGVARRDLRYAADAYERGS